MPASRVTERVFMAILRAVVDLGLSSGASPQSTEQRAMRAICGYLLYAGQGSAIIDQDSRASGKNNKLTPAPTV